MGIAEPFLAGYLKIIVSDSLAASSSMVFQSSRYILKWKTFPEICSAGFRDKGCSLFCMS